MGQVPHPTDVLAARAVGGLQSKRHALSRPVTVALARQGLPTPPGIDEKLLIVAATDRDDRRPEWSNYGGIVDVSAPGVGILSTTEGGAYTSFSSPDTEVDGTSYAAPHVAALAALLISQDPSMTPQAVYDRIKSTADPLTETGMGAGRINMYSALRGPRRDEQPPGRPTNGHLIRGSASRPCVVLVPSL